MSPIDFVRLLDYKPKWVPEPNIDDISNIEFRWCKKRCPYIEFGTEVRKDKGGQYFYYEILDYGGYVEGDFIPLTSDRRHDIILCWPKTDEDFKKLAKKINASLRNLHKKNCEKSLDGKAWL